MKFFVIKLINLGIVAGAFALVTVQKPLRYMESTFPRLRFHSGFRTAVQFGILYGFYYIGEYLTSSRRWGSTNAFGVHFTNNRLFLENKDAFM
jgi:hypothetical protein